MYNKKKIVSKNGLAKKDKFKIFYSMHKKLVIASIGIFVVLLIIFTVVYVEDVYTPPFKVYQSSSSATIILGRSGYVFSKYVGPPSSMPFPVGLGYYYSPTNSTSTAYINQSAGSSYIRLQVAYDSAEFLYSSPSLIVGGHRWWKRPTWSSPNLSTNSPELCMYIDIGLSGKILSNLHPVGVHFTVSKLRRNRAEHNSSIINNVYEAAYSDCISSKNITAIYDVLPFESSTYSENTPLYGFHHSIINPHYFYFEAHVQEVFAVNVPLNSSREQTGGLIFSASLLEVGHNITTSTTLKVVFKPYSYMIISGSKENCSQSPSAPVYIEDLNNSHTSEVNHIFFAKTDTYYKLYFSLSNGTTYSKIIKTNNSPWGLYKVFVNTSEPNISVSYTKG